ncbi:MAG TPA: alpha/beta hydrolase-fold protein [Bryobacteraceae bacterium]|jgi:enterochelin esterase family protein
MFRSYFLAAVSLAAALAQPPGGQPNPNLKSTEVLPDHQVVFRIYAPKAAAVTLSGDFVTHGRGTAGPMQKGDDGTWSLTVGPLVPDFYSYSFNVDGVRTIDPRNPMVKQGIASLDSMFLVPGPEAAFEDVQPVPHGEIRAVWYESKTLGGPRRMHVYTPPGYERGSTKYPVLYLIHGGGDEDSGWSTIGRAGFILDNQIAAGKAKPMLVVMPNGSITLSGVTNPMGGGRGATTPEAIAARVATISKLHDAFVSDLLTGIIPHVESTYRVLATRENRAIAGLSMGGAETLRTAPSNLDKFAWIGVFSMGLQEGVNAGVNSDFEQRNAAFFADPEKTNKQLKLFWIGVGKDDRTVTDGPKRLSETLKAHNIRHEFHESEGGHDWINWRLYLRDFTQLLFR